MSEAQSSRMKSTDFSIARILTDDPFKYTPVVQSSNSVICDHHERDNQQRRFITEHHNSSEQKINEEIVPKHEEKKYSLEGYVGHLAPSRSKCQDISIVNRQNNDNKNVQRSDLTWLQYTRYRPPKLPRRSYIERQTKRRPGDHPRIPFSSNQLQILEDRYRKDAYLSRNDVIEISKILRLPQNKVKIWFQNRRARQRRELLNSTLVKR